jgi:hypothetical protein
MEDSGMSRAKPQTEAAFYRKLLEQIASDPRRTRGRRLAESGLLFWDAMEDELTKRESSKTELTKREVEAG